MWYLPETGSPPKMNNLEGLLYVLIVYHACYLNVVHSDCRLCSFCVDQQNSVRIFSNEDLVRCVYSGLGSHTVARAEERMGVETSHCPSETCDARKPPKILRSKHGQCRLLQFGILCFACSWMKKWMNLVTV